MTDRSVRMKSPQKRLEHHSFGVVNESGMSLLELTVVIFVLMSLIAILFFGARAWKEGSDRSACIMQISHVQKGMRSYSNLYGFDPGETAPNLKDEIIGSGKFVEMVPFCPAQGSYGFGEESGADVIPAVGVLYMKCSLAEGVQHKPLHHESW